MFGGVMTRKLSALDRTLDEIESVRPVTPLSLQSEWVMRRAIERDLQVLSEILRDVYRCALSVLGESLAGSGAEALQRCIALGVSQDGRDMQHHRTSLR